MLEEEDGEHADHAESKLTSFVLVKQVLLLFAWLLLFIWSIYDAYNHGPARRRYEGLPKYMKDELKQRFNQERHDSLMKANETYRIAYEREQQELQATWEEHQRRKLGRSFEHVMSNMPGIAIDPHDCRDLKGGILEYSRGGQRFRFVGDLENLSTVEYHCNVSGGMYPAHAQFLHVLFVNILGLQAAKEAEAALQHVLEGGSTQQVVAVAERHVAITVSRQSGELTVVFAR
ncbi:MAG: hypothetical protein JSS89_01520 [Bacteroidetes bacterium]|nr:hypothetical protein [Bacteroidota bacterium]